MAGNRKGSGQELPVHKKDKQTYYTEIYDLIRKIEDETSLRMAYQYIKHLKK